MAEDLVRPAADRLRRRRGDTEQDIADRIGHTGGLRGPGHVKSARPVMQECGIGGTQGGGDGRVALMAGRSDRVEARALCLQPTRGKVEMPARGLGLEQLKTLAACEPTVAGDLPLIAAVWLLFLQGTHRVDEMPIEPCGLVLDHQLRRKARSGAVDSTSI